MEIPSPSEMENIIHLMDSGQIDLVQLLKNMDEHIDKAKDEAYSRKATMEKVEKWVVACDKERWLEEYNMVTNSCTLIFIATPSIPTES
ncbi:hypothetical protein RND81_08G069600 [Saponaria officinalis]|uniref:Uncharacterized protein n=1 Tax=Saponaria officinalis TaxID=3572 RepID=A0AAW1J489_SAPOF